MELVAEPICGSIQGGSFSIYTFGRISTLASGEVGTWPECSLGAGLWQPAETQPCRRPHNEAETIKKFLVDGQEGRLGNLPHAGREDLSCGDVGAGLMSVLFWVYELPLRWALQPPFRDWLPVTADRSETKCHTPDGAGWATSAGPAPPRESGSWAPRSLCRRRWHQKDSYKGRIPPERGVLSERLHTHVQLSHYRGPVACPDVGAGQQWGWLTGSPMGQSHNES